MNIWLHNFPIPEPFIIGLVAGGIVQYFFPVPFTSASIAWDIIGSVLIVIGVAIATWAVLVAGENHLRNPERLLVSGPYAMSRNPLYFSWFIASIGLSLFLNSLWLLLAAIIAFIYLNIVIVPLEEKLLERIFEVNYQDYKKRVRRWL